ncbi:uncharacterized protein LOC106720295 [Papilio machaon]|uniref:uncharacterized protein LOC106720295 n=1 Tax=Papilio machaon TaxID=76193 RepID=UPI0006EAD4F3|nr:uncharacterized protein LOC106720295 [Papilio machaon]
MDIYNKLSESMNKLETLFQSRMTQYESELKMAASGDSQSVHKTIAGLSRDFMEFRHLIWQTVSTLKTQMELVLVGMDRFEMASRSNVLLFHGIPEEDNVTQESLILNIVNTNMKLTTITADDIVKCHRLGVTRTSKPRPLLVRFHDFRLRNIVWSGKTSLKGTKVTLSEFLTKTRHEVFMQARKHFGIRRCWTSDGRIVVLLPNKSRYKLETEAELASLMSQYPTSETEPSENISKVTPSGTDVQKKTGFGSKRLPRSK